MVKSRSNGGLEGVGVSFSDVNLSLIFLSYLVAVDIRLPYTLLQITSVFYGSTSLSRSNLEPTA